MSVDRMIEGYQVRARDLVTAQQRMEDDGCPHALPFAETLRFAANIARVDLASGSAIGKQILSGQISRISDLDARRARVHDLGAPGPKGNI